MIVGSVVFDTRHWGGKSNKANALSSQYSGFPFTGMGCAFPLALKHLVSSRPAAPYPSSHFSSPRFGDEASCLAFFLLLPPFLSFLWGVLRGAGLLPCLVCVLLLRDYQPKAGVYETRSKLHLCSRGVRALDRNLRKVALFRPVVMKGCVEEACLDEFVSALFECVTNLEPHVDSLHDVGGVPR